jgi:chitin synthase
LTFGFTQTVCGTPGNRVHGGEISTGSLIINGFTYDLSTWNHPAVGVFNGSQNPLYTEPWNAAGKDASFMFQNVNKHCFGLITKAEGSSVADDATGALGWYFPCNLRGQNGTANVDATNATSAYTCHIGNGARDQYDKLPKSGSIYYTWDDVHDPRRNLVVYQECVRPSDSLPPERS